MMRILVTLGLTALLASCGVDGAPTPPQKSGVTISGQARIGVAGGL